MNDSVPPPPAFPSLLARYGGDRPEAPDWFRWAIGHLPDERHLEVDGARIEVLSWGEVGAPGLIFVHGNLAHAHWWSFIAPFFADRRRVVALSLSGMGGSDHRSSYSLVQFGREVLQVAEASGLFATSAAPVIAPVPSTTTVE